MKLLNVLALTISAATLAACQPSQSNTYAKGNINPTVQNIISAQGRDVNSVGVNTKQVSQGVYDVDATAPEGTVLAAAHDMFQKRAYELCSGDNYTFSIKSQQNVSFYEFVGREKKQMNMPVVSGTVRCNTRNASAPAGQVNTL